MGASAGRGHGSPSRWRPRRQWATPVPFPLREGYPRALEAALAVSRESGHDRGHRGELVTFRTYLDPVEAQLARGRLDAEGIEAYVLDEGLHNL